MNVLDALMPSARLLRWLVVVVFVVFVVVTGVAGGGGPVVADAGPSSFATQRDLVGGPGSQLFGIDAVVLANGNYVVTDPYWDSPTATDVGAVYLYDGTTDALISTVTGSSANDRVGSYGVEPLPNGNFLVSSPSWDLGGTIDVGAVTFGDGTSGVSGVVSSRNSLHGTSARDGVGDDGRGGGEFPGGVQLLANGNYVVATHTWDFGAVTDAGAVTFGSGTRGVVGPITPENSLHGTSVDEHVGGGFFTGQVTTLSNGDYVVHTPSWDHGSVAEAGAVTYGDGSVGVTGPVTTANSMHGISRFDLDDATVTELTTGSSVVAASNLDLDGVTDAGAVRFVAAGTLPTGPFTAANSLHGTTDRDRIGEHGVTALVNGSYVVASPGWQLGSAHVGAVTFADGATGLAGPVTTANSLHGTLDGSGVGSEGVVPLTNGNFVVVSPVWDLPGTVNVGAVTFVDAAVGTSGPVTTDNSLHGTTDRDVIGREVVALANGNYVVASSTWDDGPLVDVGAAVLGDGVAGTSGPVSRTNSLHGTTAGDGVGGTVTPLANGNYVVRSGAWDLGSVVNVGAVTFVGGRDGIIGPVTTANSLHGTSRSDTVGSDVHALANGNYVVRSPWWDHGGAPDAGAATFGNGVTGVTGAVTTGNSLHGTSELDRVGFERIVELTTGNYVVRTPSWDHGDVPNVGAVTFASGTVGISGPVSTDNSLYGTTATDHVGGSSPGVLAVADGGYIVHSELWDHGAIRDAGAVTRGDGSRGVWGPVTTANSVVGTPPGKVLAPWPWRFVDGSPTRAPLLSTSGNRLPVPTTQNRVLMIDAGMVAPYGTECFAVAGSPGDAAIVNLTPVEARGAGHALLTPSDVVDPPVASNVNFGVGTVDPNVAVSLVGADDEVCVANSEHTSVHLVADHLGSIDADAFTPATTAGAPSRKVDTRIAVGGTTVPPSGRICFEVGGSPGDLAIVNLTPVLATAPGHGQLVSSDVARPPVASNVNFRPGSVDPNVAAAPVGSDGRVCYVNSELSAVDLVADHLGTIAASAYVPATTSGAPDRRVDTRIGVGGTIVRPSGRLCFGVAGAPGDVAVVNLTPVEAEVPGYGLLISSDVASPPVASNVNFAPGTVDPNLAMAIVGADRTVCYVNSVHGHVHLVADHLATIRGSSYTPAQPSGAPKRTVDTRIP